MKSNEHRWETAAGRDQELHRRLLPGTDSSRLSVALRSMESKLKEVDLHLKERQSFYERFNES